MTRNKYITLLKMKNAIKKVIKNKLKFKYESEHGCFYIRDGKPDCLIGCALYNMGVKKNILQQLNRAINYLPCSVDDIVFTEILANNNWTIDQEAIKFATTVQSEQDAEQPWEKCYEAGLETLDE